MRKNELIEKLNALPGNPEIVLWNGFVGDYHHIDAELICVTLVKESREFLASRGVSSAEDVEAAFRDQEWDFPNEFLNNDEYKRWYGRHQKKVYVLNAKPRGKEAFDRLGPMRY